MFRTTADLQASDTDRIAAHLLRLSPEDRSLRFSAGMRARRWVEASARPSSRRRLRCHRRTGPVSGIGPRLRGGALVNSAAAEALTSVLIFMNKTYKIDGAGFRVTGAMDAEQD